MASNLHEMTHPTASGHTIRLPAAAGRSAPRFRSWAAYAQPKTGRSRQTEKQAGSDRGRLMSSHSRAAAAKPRSRRVAIWGA